MSFPHSQSGCLQDLGSPGLSAAQGHGQLWPKEEDSLGESNVQPVSCSDPTGTEQPSVSRSHPSYLPLAGLDKPDWDPSVTALRGKRASPVTATHSWADNQLPAAKPPIPVCTSAHDGHCTTFHHLLEIFQVTRALCHPSGSFRLPGHPWSPSFLPPFLKQ